MEIKLHVLKEENYATTLLKEYLFKQRIFFSAIPDSQYDLEARLYASAIMEKTEESGWRIKHVARDLKISKESAEKVLNILENSHYTAMSLYAALKKTNEDKFTLEEEKLYRYYRVRYSRMCRSESQSPAFVKEFDPNYLQPRTYFSYLDGYYRTSFLAENDTISIIWA
jgi:hypothetical protein